MNSIGNMIKCCILKVRESVPGAIEEPMPVTIFFKYYGMTILFFLKGRDIR